MAKYILKQEAIFALINEANTHNNPVKRAYTRAAAIIEQITAADVQPVDRWISFKDKQPQEGGFYLTYYAEHIRVSQWFPSKNWYNEHGGNVTNMVEYWQPLPEPPKQ